MVIKWILEKWPCKLKMLREFKSLQKSLMSSLLKILLKQVKRDRNLKYESCIYSFLAFPVKVQHITFLESMEIWKQLWYLTSFSNMSATFHSQTPSFLPKCTKAKISVIKWHDEDNQGTKMATTVGAVHLLTAYIPLRLWGPKKALHMRTIPAL